MTTQDEKKVFPRLLVSVIHEEDEKKLDLALDELHIPVCFRSMGKGTAPSEILDLFGLSGTGRLITLCLVPKFRVEETFSHLSKKMPFRKKGGGIAFTVPINGLQSPMRKLLSDEAKEALQKKAKGDEMEMRANSDFSVIWVSIARGYSEDVVNAAREAGARGGTVMKGRRRDAEEVRQYFGIRIQAEQEFVMIVVRNEKKADVMSAICRSCGMNTEAHGVVLALPVDDVMGIE